VTTFLLVIKISKKSGDLVMKSMPKYSIIINVEIYVFRQEFVYGTVKK